MELLLSIGQWNYYYKLANGTIIINYIYLFHKIEHKIILNYIE